jgi:aminoglycoside phosphotransferase (APT) family kinase protein
MNELERKPVVTALLCDWARMRFGGTATIEDLSRLPGHSGITYAFRVTAKRQVTELVAKLAPIGVAQRPDTDVVYQVPVLRRIALAGVRVPEVVAFGLAGENGFPASHLILRRARGETLGDTFAGRLGASDTATRELFDQAIAELARIHSVSWPEAAAAGPVMRDLPAEINHWAPLMDRALIPGWRTLGHTLRQRLFETMPPPQPPGVVHGDFYSNNWLFEGDRLSAILDWEGSSIGDQRLDVGWLCMMYDPGSWGPTRRPWLDGAPKPEWILERYEHHAGRPVLHPHWWRALAAWRLASLTALLVRLHRTGRRVDPTSDVFHESFGYLVRGALEQLQA